jgi:hypothetical protein
MTTHTLSTRFARYENGEYVVYPAGAPVDLSLDELGMFAPGIVSLAQPQSQSVTSSPEPEEEETVDIDPTKTIFRTTLAQPKKKAILDNPNGELITDTVDEKKD